MGRRGLVSQGRVRPGSVVVGHPGGDDGTGLGHAGENRLVKQLVTHASVEALDEAVLHGPAGGDVVPLHAMVLHPCQHGVAGQLGAVVGDDHLPLAAQARRIARVHGWANTGSRIFERVMAVTKRHFVLVADGEHQFVLPQGVDTNHFPCFRRSTGDVVRPVDEIALPELAALAREVQEEGFEGDAALSAMAKLAGLQKLRQSSRQRFVDVMIFNI